MSDRNIGKSPPVKVESEPIGGLSLVEKLTQIGPYELRGILGRGGMAVVFRAFQPQLDREVAIKLLAPQLAEDENLQERFLVEARAIARLNHPNILTIHDFGQEQEIAYIVTALIEGGNLRQYLNEPMAPERATKLLLQLAGALDYAHKKGVIHRDVKPGNILMDQGERPLLSDFGIAKLVQETQGLTSIPGIGTPAYMSPEQASSEPLDGRSDQYSLAVTFYEMLTGRLPFPSTTRAALIKAHLNNLPPDPRIFNPRVTSEMVAVLQKALLKQPQERYNTCLEFAHAFEAAVTNKDLESEPTWPVPGGAEKSIRRQDEAKNSPAWTISSIKALRFGPETQATIARPRLLKAFLVALLAGILIGLMFGAVELVDQDSFDLGIFSGLMIFASIGVGIVYVYLKPGIRKVRSILFIYSIMLGFPALIIGENTSFSFWLVVLILILTFFIKESGRDSGLKETAKPLRAINNVLNSEFLNATWWRKFFLKPLAVLLTDPIRLIYRPTLWERRGHRLIFCSLLFGLSFYSMRSYINAIFYYGWLGFIPILLAWSLFGVKQFESPWLQRLVSLLNKVPVALLTVELVWFIPILFPAITSICLMLTTILMAGLVYFIKIISGNSWEMVVIWAIIALLPLASIALNLIGLGPLTLTGTMGYTLVISLVYIVLRQKTFGQLLLSGMCLTMLMSLVLVPLLIILNVPNSPDYFVSFLLPVSLDTLALITPLLVILVSGVSISFKLIYCFKDKGKNGLWALLVRNRKPLVGGAISGLLAIGLFFLLESKVLNLDSSNNVFSFSFTSFLYWWPVLGFMLVTIFYSLRPPMVRGLVFLELGLIPLLLLIFIIIDLGTTFEFISTLILSSTILVLALSYLFFPLFSSTKKPRIITLAGLFITLLNGLLLIIFTYNLLAEPKPVARLSGIALEARGSSTFQAWSFNNTFATADYSAIRLWDATGKSFGTFKESEAESDLVFHYPISSLAWSPDGKLLAIGINENIKLWQAGGKFIGTLIGQTNEVTGLSWSSDSTLLASSSNSPFVFSKGDSIEDPPSVFLPPDKTANMEVPLADSPAPYYSGVANGYRLDKTVRIWRADGQPIATIQGHNDRITGLQWSPTTNILATASSDNTVKLWSGEGRLLATLKGHVKSVVQLSWSGDGKLLATGSEDGTIRLWGMDGKPLFVLRGHSLAITSLGWSPDNTLLASGSQDATIRVWSTDGRNIAIFGGHSSSVNSVIWSKDGEYVYSGSADRTIKAWTIAGNLRQTYRGGVSGATLLLLSPDGTTLANFDGTNQIKLWKVGGDS